MAEIKFKVVRGIQCPTCGSEEMHPDGDKLLIRAYKVQLRDGRWRSHCLVCAGHYNNPTDLVLTPENYDENKGWF
jgi:hypothetical protein